MIDNRLKMYFEDACDILDSLDIEYGPITNVRVNTRAKSRWGQCSYSKANETFSIEISSMLLDASYTAIMDTMIHELLHCHKNRLCHTGEWKACANLVNVVYNYNIKRCTSAAEKNIEIARPETPAKYKITCQGCGRTFSYKKKSKIIKLLMNYPTNHGCRCCCGSTDLTLETL